MSYIEHDTIAIRTAAPQDAGAVAHLAALDSKPALAGGVLIAEVDGQARAAISVATGSTVADPFFRTADLLVLLRLRAATLREDLPVERPRKRVLHIPMRKHVSNDPLAYTS